MADKIALSIIADAGCPTGFATVTHHIAGYLQETGEYDVSILGVNYHGQPNEWSKKFNIWPAKLGGDYLGVGYTGKFVEETKPEVLFLFQDFWNIKMYISQIPHPFPGLVSYYPVDAPNVKGTYLLPMAACTEVGTYTKFGVEESVRGAKEAYQASKLSAESKGFNYIATVHVDIQGPKSYASGMPSYSGSAIIPMKRLKQLCSSDNYFQIPHGIDMKDFHEINKKEARESYNLPEDWFIVGNVNRNQSRKRLDLTVRAFAEFAKDKDNARLILHCVANDERGWDIGQLAIYYGVAEKVIMADRVFQHHSATVEQLNRLYNTFDVQVNTGGGEGWGLTNFEGAACGVPQIVPDWSATREIWKDAGLLIRPAEVRHELNLINTMQATCSSTHTAELLNDLYESDDLRKDVGAKCFEVTQRPEYRWENVGAEFDKVFKRARGQVPKVAAVPLNEKGVLEIKRDREKQKNEKKKR